MQSHSQISYTLVQSSFLLLELYVNKDLCIIFCCLFFEPLTCLLLTCIDFSICMRIHLQTFNIVDTNLPVPMSLCWTVQAMWICEIGVAGVPEDSKDDMVVGLLKMCIIKMATCWENEK